MGLEANVISLHRLWDCWPPCIGRICNHVGFFQLSQFQRGRAGSKRALPLVSLPRFSGLQMNFPSLWASFHQERDHLGTAVGYAIANAGQLRKVIR